MANSPKTPSNTQRMARVHALGHPSSPAPRTAWTQGQAGKTTPARPIAPLGHSRAAGGPQPTATSPNAPKLPNVPATPGLTQGSTNDLIVTWPMPATDATHEAPTGFVLQYSLTSGGAWTAIAGVSSPYDLTGLTYGATYAVQIQAVNAAGMTAWSPSATMTLVIPGPFPPNAPSLVTAAPAVDGSAGKLTVSWTAPATDSTHGAATGYTVRYSPSGANSWTLVTNASNPCTLTGLTGGAACDVQVAATNAAANPSPWSSTVTATPWGTTIAPGGWVAATTQTHGASVAPNGGVQATVTPSPTAVGGVAFGWSQSNTTIPTSGLIAAGADGQTNGWGQWFNAPATAGTWYLWTIAQGAGNVTIGASVTAAITVT